MLFRSVAIYFEPTRCVRGWLWGEAFFDGRPTSWWRDVVHDCVKRQEPNWWRDWNRRVIPEEWRPTALSLVGDSRAKSVLQQLTLDEDECVSEFAGHFLSVIERNPDALNNDFERRVEFGFFFFKTRLNARWGR